MKHRLAKVAVAAALLCAWLGGCAGRARLAHEPMPESHPDLRGRMLAHVGESLLPFWLENCVDRQYGGYLTDLNRDGSPRGTDKVLAAQARTIWTLSRLWRSGYHDPRIREAAAQGLEFLAQNFNDEAEEGWFWQVARDGTPRDMAKKTCGHAAVIQAMAQYHRAFQDPVALRLAQLTFDVLERHAKDPENPGYLDFMTRDWTPDLEGSGHVKTADTHMHLMAAFTDLYLVTRSPAHGQRAREMLDLLVNRCYLPEEGCCINAFRYDWQPVEDGPMGEQNKTTSYGLNLELAWQMQRTAEALDRAPDAYRRMGLRLVDHALRYGWDDRAGAMCCSGPHDGPATDCFMEWRTQAESAVALDWAWRATGEPRYLSALRRQVAWVLERQADPVYGGWYGALWPDGSVKSAGKARPWHGPYHEVRACLNVGLGSWQ